MAASMRIYCRPKSLNNSVIYRSQRFYFNKIRQLTSYESNLISKVFARCFCYGSRDVNILPLGSADRLIFDTHAVVSRLEESGINRVQAECITSILNQLMQRIAELQNKDMVTKEQQEIMLQQIMAQIAAVKKDMVILEKSQFSALKGDNEKLSTEVQQLRGQLKDEVVKLKNAFTLDINLEKSRAKEANNISEQDIKSTNNRITTEIANLNAKMEATKFESLKYFGATLLGSVTIMLGAYRIFLH
ncbi:mitochondrial calcium uniporter regulator 1-like [Anneissia japonica]|uniref:mitochondrial calcium uniporter regulator 1-like n=1 Tax=Anneissia japonica TaxID=1529436 RepID=UPI00142597A4|nr:mitochondrial calcium uniporter regulator 1-like [Anneissia japonica]